MLALHGPRVDLVQRDAAGGDFGLAKAHRAGHGNVEPLDRLHQPAALGFRELGRPADPAAFRPATTSVSPTRCGSQRSSRRGHAPLAGRGTARGQQRVQFLLRATSGSRSQRSTSVVGLRMAADGVADVQHDRPRDAEMRKQQRPATAGQHMAVIRPLDRSITRTATSGSVIPCRASTQGAWLVIGTRAVCGGTMRCPRRGRPAVSVAGRAAGRIRLPAGGQHDLFGLDRVAAVVTQSESR